jgi:hypothetical protein
MTTYYDILEVCPRASANEIKAAHRRLVKKFHPDRTLGADTAVRRSLEDRFRDIQEAYDTLKDKAKRAEYDDMLAMLNSGEYYEPPPPPPPPLPTVTFTTKPSTAEKGQLITISWASKNATDLRMDLGFGGCKVGPHGCEFVRLQDSTTFTLTATGPGGTISATARVTVMVISPMNQDPKIRIVGELSHDLLTSEGFKVVEVTKDSVLYKHSNGFKVLAERDRFICVHPDEPDKPYTVNGWFELGAVLGPCRAAY